MGQQRVVIIRGLPGTGKSTLAKKYDSSYVHCEADQYFMKDGQYIFDKSRIKDAHAFCLLKAEYALYQGHNVVVSNTFTRKWEYEPYVNLAKSYDAEVEIIILKEKYTNIHNVPNGTMKHMAERWED